jgi:hypothetical protein
LGKVRADGLDIWVERRGQGPDVLLIAGLGDPAEVWRFQLEGLQDRYRLTAFDNRGVGRTPLPEGPLSVAAMADDAAALLRALEVPDQFSRSGASRTWISSSGSYRVLMRACSGPGGRLRGRPDALERGYDQDGGAHHQDAADSGR